MAGLLISAMSGSASKFVITCTSPSPRPTEVCHRQAVGIGANPLLRLLLQSSHSSNLNAPAPRYSMFGIKLSRRISPKHNKFRSYPTPYGAEYHWWIQRGHHTVNFGEACPTFQISERVPGHRRISYSRIISRTIWASQPQLIGPSRNSNKLD